MANERTTVVLSKEAAGKIAAAMKARGETKDTYFSNPAGGDFRAAYDPDPGGTLYEPGYTPPDITSKSPELVPPDVPSKYFTRLALAGISEGRKNAEMTMALLAPPDKDTLPQRQPDPEGDADRQTVWASQPVERTAVPPPPKSVWKNPAVAALTDKLSLLDFVDSRPGMSALGNEEFLRIRKNLWDISTTEPKRSRSYPGKQNRSSK